MPRPQLSAQQQSYIYLRDAIVTGALKAGKRIDVEEVARAVEVSRIPVREALRQLDSEGLVTIQPNRGAVVTTLDTKEILELFEMRAALEGLAVRRATPGASEDDLAELRHLIDRMRQAEHDHLLWTERHDEFHDALCRLGGRPQLSLMLRRLRLALRPSLRLYTIDHPSETKGHEHERMIDAILTRDPAHAERVIREHVMSNAEVVVAAIIASTQRSSEEAAT